MGKTTWKGIYARKASIRIYFVYAGNEYFESLNIAPTPANMNYADSMRKEILRRIELETFKFEDFFPESKNAKKEVAQKSEKPKFKEVAIAWLDSKLDLEHTTKESYQNIMNAYFIEPLGERIMDSISFLELNKVITGLIKERQLSKKTYNNSLTVIRQIYAFAFDAGYCPENFASKFSFLKKNKAKPDPLELNEIPLVLQDMQNHYHEIIQIYFALQFRIGFRPSEGISLQWCDVDWNKKEVLVKSAKVRGVYKSTKTDRDRIVELDDECMALLTRMKKHTFMKSEYIFINPITDKPFYDTSDFVQKYWRPSLKRCKIRDRDARQVRHTCATIMLHAGCKPAWAANQLGHSIEMFLRVYSTWLPENNKREELSKMSAMFKTNSPLEAAK